MFIVKYSLCMPLLQPTAVYIMTCPKSELKIIFFGSKIVVHSPVPVPRAQFRTDNPTEYDIMQVHIALYLAIIALRIYLPKAG